MPETVSDRLEPALCHLREQGFRITRKRRRIVEILLASSRPLSALQILEKCRFGPTDLVTVYRNLETLSSAGLVQRIPLEDGLQVFEAIEPGEHYHHLICRSCLRVERLTASHCHQLERFAESRGFVNLNHFSEIYGFCPDCQKPEEKARG